MIFFTSTRNLLFLLFGVLVVLLVGCSTTFPLRPVDPAISAPAADGALLMEQHTDPRSQALSAFVQFRLAATDDDWQNALDALQRATTYDPDSTYLQLLLARVYLHLEHPEPAIDLLNRLIDDGFAVFEAHLLLGDVYVMQQQPADAIDHFTRALELEPDNEPLYLRLAMAFVQLELIDEALATLEELLQKRPNADQAQISLARIYRDNDQPEAAIRIFRRYLERRPGQSSIVLELGQLLEQHDKKAAMKLYQDVLRENPAAPSIRQQLAQLYLTLQEPELALKQLLIVREQLPGLLPGDQIGLLYLHINRWQEAAKEFHQVIADGQDTGRDHYYLALALIGQLEYEAAIEHLKRVASDEGIYRDAMLQLAYLYLQQGAVEDGTHLLLSLLAEGHKDSEVYYYLIAFFHNQEDMMAAQDYAEEAVSLYPQNARLLYQQGILFDAMDDHPAALESMEKVLQIDEFHADALNFLAYSQAESSTDLDLALKRAKLALELKPEGYIEDTVGWIYFKLGKYPQSRIHLERAIDLQPDDKVILEHLGDLYHAMELFDEAEQAYRDALNVDPDAPGVLEKLEKLIEELGQ